MKSVLGVIVLYTIWTLLDFVNIFLIYDKFLLMERRPAKKTRFIWIPLMFLVSCLYGLIYTGLIFHKIIAACIYIPYFLKIIPVLWSYFPGRKKDILLVLFYYLLAATISQGMFALVNTNPGETFYGVFIYDICEVVTVAMITLFLLILLFFRRNNILKVYFGKLSIFQYITFCMALFVANLIEAEMIMLYVDDMLFKVLSIANIAIVVILMCQIILVRESDTRKGKIIDVLDEQMDKVIDCYNEVIERETQTKKFRHDIRNLLFVLHSLVEQGENEKALEYIEKLEDICRKTTKKYDTGNFAADTLLSAKAAAAEEWNTEIRFNGYIPCDFENVDLVILLSNILDNALEACEKINGKKSIFIESILQKRMWIISVKNPVAGNVKIQKNRITTTKANKELHGYGIQNMERIAKKYDGNLELRCEDGYFIARVMLLLKNQ